MWRGESPTFQAFLATLFTWGLTALGASLVFLVPKSLPHRTQRKVLDASLGFAAGGSSNDRWTWQARTIAVVTLTLGAMFVFVLVMLAASYWSLLAPALESAESSGIYGAHSYIPVSIGLLLGAAFVYGADLLIPAEAGDAVSVLSSGISKKEDTEVVNTPKLSSSSSPRSSPRTARKRTASTNKLDEVWDEMEANRSSSSKKKASPRRPATTARKSARSRDDLPSSVASIAENENQEESSEPGQSLRERQQSWHRILLLVIAIVIHNFPEGLAVGVGFGRLSTIDPPLEQGSLVALNGVSTNATVADIVASNEQFAKEYDSLFAEARNLAIGIGLQNFPEGLAVSLPLLRVGYSRSKAFWYGQLSGMVEPVGGILGAFLISLMQPVLPYALAFAAGAMIFVVCEDLIPETRAPGGFPTLASWFVMIGFVVMMSMDVGLG